MLLTGVGGSSRYSVFTTEKMVLGSLFLPGFFAIAKVDFSFGINNRFKCIIPPKLPIKYFFVFESQCCCVLMFCLYHCISASLAVHPLLGDSFWTLKKGTAVDEYPICSLSTPETSKTGNDDVGQPLWRFMLFMLY